MTRVLSHRFDANCFMNMHGLHKLPLSTVDQTTADMAQEKWLHVNVVCLLIKLNLLHAFVYDKSFLHEPTMASRDKITVHKLCFMWEKQSLNITTVAKASLACQLRLSLT